MKTVSNVYNLHILTCLSTSTSNFVKETPSKKYAVITVFSENHACEAMHACRTYSYVSEIQTGKIAVIAFYAADVTNKTISKYTELCPFVRLRPISLKQYPKYVSDLKNYRFKFLIVKEVLQEFDAILYGDSSVRLEPGATTETLTDLFKSMKTTFARQGIRMFTYASHYNYPVTHPLMYKYFHVPVEKMKKTVQLQATVFMVSNTESGHNVIDKVAKCAIEENCMAPKGAKVQCPFPEYTQNTKVVCHRFDQSAVNMRLIELYGTNLHLYYQESQLLNIVRMKTCSMP
uniref:Glycosyltransferase family 92 protein n=1 Tax=Panagrellus redivivus TaxID=6233 RepID=A0A7E4ZV54_PANRE